MLDGIQEVLDQPQQVPARRRIAAGRKLGRGPLVIEPAMTAADRDAHAAASHVRKPKAVA